jgi:hypothetical protein
VNAAAADSSAVARQPAVVASGGAVRIASAKRSAITSRPPNSTSRLSAKWRLPRHWETEERALGTPRSRTDSEIAVVGFVERRVRSSVVRIPAITHFGEFLAMVITLDNPTSSLATRRILDWEPTHPGLLADFDKGDYFTTTATPDNQ